MKYNLGAGKLPIEGYINVDVRDVPGMDLVADVRKLDMIESNSADEVVARDVLEHMPRREWRLVLDEWVRVLRTGGVMKLRFPDMELMIQTFLNHNFKPAYPEKYDEKGLKQFNFERFGQLVFGDQDVPENAHLSCLSSWIVKEHLELIGMELIKEFRDGCCDVRLTLSKGKLDPSINLDHPDYAYR